MNLEYGYIIKVKNISIVNLTMQGKIIKSGGITTVVYDDDIEYRLQNHFLELIEIVRGKKEDIDSVLSEENIKPATKRRSKRKKLNR